MSRVKDFVVRERLYLLLIVFVILVNFTIKDPFAVKTTGRTIVSKAESGKPAPYFLGDRDKIEQILDKNKSLALIYNLAALLIFAILILGIVIDIILVQSKISGKRLPIEATTQATVPWDAWDIAKVVILFMFFGYMIVLSESALAKIVPALKNRNLRAIINSSVLDIVGVIFIINFTVVQYRQKLISLGLTLKNFTRNVYYGIVGYIAVVPVLFAILVVTAIVITLTKYIPEKQFVVQLFMDEKNGNFLLYTSLFAAIAGPIVEELFFRGFMYSACKKYMNKAVAILFTASLFAALHAHPIGFLPILTLGVLLAYLYEKTGTLIAPITVHVVHNLVMVCFVFTSRSLGV